MHEAGAEGQPQGKPIGRRVFLGMLAAGGAGVLWGAKASDALSKLLRPVTERDVTGLTSLLPSAGRFRFYSVVGFSPHRSDEAYRLDVTGLVDKPLSLGLNDLKAMPSVRLVKDFQCVTGWRGPQVPWAGVRLADVLDAAGGGAGAAALTFRSFDGQYTESPTLDQAPRPAVVAGYAMEGRPVSS